MVLIWDYDEKELRKTKEGKRLILERMINNGIYLKDKEKISAISYMGKIVFTPFQKMVFAEFSKQKELRDQFYFGGGTALSVFYLQHRYSDDLDFFSEKEFDKNLLVEIMSNLSRKLGITSRITKKETILWFELTKGSMSVKVDFLIFPYKRIEKGLSQQGVSIDSPKDIGANKLLTINLETNPKDYVDLYFLLKEKFTIWDLLYAVEAKFRLQLDLVSLGKDFLAAEKIDVLPKMIKPLDLIKMRKFFQQKASEIGKKAVI